MRMHKAFWTGEFLRLFDDFNTGAGKETSLLFYVHRKFKKYFFEKLHVYVQLFFYLRVRVKRFLFT